MFLSNISVFCVICVGDRFKGAMWRKIRGRGDHEGREMLTRRGPAE